MPKLIVALIVAFVAGSTGIQILIDQSSSQGQVIVKR